MYLHLPFSPYTSPSSPSHTHFLTTSDLSESGVGSDAGKGLEEDFGSSDGGADTVESVDILADFFFFFVFLGLRAAGTRGFFSFGLAANKMNE